MKKSVAVFLCLLIYSPSWGAIALSVNGAKATAAPTTDAVDTLNTSTNLIILGLSCFSVSPCATPTDSATNTWTGLTPRAGTTSGAETMFYAWNPNVSATHTFTGNAAVFGITMIGFSGANTASDPFDKQAGTSQAGGTTLSPGSITPDSDGEVIVSYLGGFGTGNTTYSIDSSLSITNQIGFAGGVAYGQALAYYVQPTAGAISPQWSWAGTNAAGATVASFRASTGGGGPVTRLPTRMLNFYRGGVLR